MIFEVRTGEGIGRALTHRRTPRHLNTPSWGEAFKFTSYYVAEENLNSCLRLTIRPFPVARSAMFTPKFIRGSIKKTKEKRKKRHAPRKTKWVYLSSYLIMLTIYF